LLFRGFHSLLDTDRQKKERPKRESDMDCMYPFPLCPTASGERVSQERESVTRGKRVREERRNNNNWTSTQGHMF
jgi:hypothetical protein